MTFCICIWVRSSLCFTPHSIRTLSPRLWINIAQLLPYMLGIDELPSMLSRYMENGKNTRRRNGLPDSCELYTLILRRGDAKWIKTAFGYCRTWLLHKTHTRSSAPMANCHWQYFMFAMTICIAVTVTMFQLLQCAMFQLLHWQCFNCCSTNVSTVAVPMFQLLQCQCFSYCSANVSAVAVPMFHTLYWLCFNCYPAVCQCFSYCSANVSAIAVPMFQLLQCQCFSCCSAHVSAVAVPMFQLLQCQCFIHCIGYVSTATLQCDNNISPKAQDRVGWMWKFLLCLTLLYIRAQAL